MKKKKRLDDDGRWKCSRAKLRRCVRLATAGNSIERALQRKKKGKELGTWNLELGRGCLNPGTIRSELYIRCWFGSGSGSGSSSSGGSSRRPAAKCFLNFFCP